jgi:hypothetical protein
MAQPILPYSRSSRDADLTFLIRDEPNSGRASGPLNPDQPVFP